MSHFIQGESHPGVRLNELLRKASMTHGELTARLGVSSYRLRTLLKGEKSIDMNLALKLACVFPEHTARDWLDMQTVHDLDQAYASGKMDVIAHAMGVTKQNISKADWMMEGKQRSDSIQVPLRYPMNHMMDALSEKLDFAPQDIVVKAIRHYWEHLDRGDLPQVG